MASGQGRGGAYEHRGDCRRKHRQGHWCWLDAEIESLESQASQNRDWSAIAKTFTIDGFVRHHTLQCFKKWTEEFRDPNQQEAMPAIKLEEDNHP